MKTHLFANIAIKQVLRNKFWRLILHQFTKESDINVTFVMPLLPGRPIFIHISRKNMKTEVKEPFIRRSFNFNKLCLKIEHFGKSSVPRRHYQNFSDMQYVPKLELKPKIEFKFKRIKEDMEVQKGLEIIEKLEPPNKKAKLGQEQCIFS